MTTTKRIYVGGSFAPPLTSEKLAKYRQLADTATEQVREIMLKLCDMVELFQQTPVSPLPGTPHPSGRGTIIPLTPEEIERIWDAVPWKDEVEMYKTLFQPLQQDVCARNTRRIEEWQASVRNLVVSKHFAHSAEHRAAVKALSARETWEPFFTEEQLTKADELSEKVEAVHNEVTAAFQSKNHESIPYPNLEQAELRDAAFHLLWYADLLAVDQEPITTDML